MKWTSEPPTVGGWYWHEKYKGTLCGNPVFERECRHVCVLTITYRDGTKRIQATADGVDINLIAGRWAGPIQEPEE